MSYSLHTCKWVCAFAALMLFSISSASAQALPTRLEPARVTAIANVMAGIEEHGDAFKDAFNKALRSSTVPMDRRSELKDWVHHLEDTVDDLQEEYNEHDMKGTSDKLRDAMELAAGINRFMLRAEFGEANAAWSRLRDDLNTLAGSQAQPVLPVLVIREVPAR